MADGPHGWRPPSTALMAPRQGRLRSFMTGTKAERPAGLPWHGWKLAAGEALVSQRFEQGAALVDRA